MKSVAIIKETIKELKTDQKSKNMNDMDRLINQGWIESLEWLLKQEEKDV